MYQIGKKRTSIFRSLMSLCAAVLLIGSLSACDMMENQLKTDREGGLEMQDYRDALAPRLADDMNEWANSNNESSIPQIQPYISSGGLDNKPMPLVSISVNQTVPLKDVLFELVKQTEYDLELDPNIIGSIIFTARERPFDQVVERIANMAGLRYQFEDGMLRVEVDSPYNEVYKIDYINYVRNNSSQVSNDVSVVSGSGTDTGSNFTATSESQSDFWGELESNLTQVIAGANANLSTANDPRITVAAQNPEVQAISPAADGSVEVSAPQAVLNVESLPVSGENTGASPSATAVASGPTFSLNRQAGIVNLYASEKTHKEVQKYLKILKESVTSQVLIEAKVLEVSLLDEYATGISWDLIGLPGELGVNFGSATGSGLLGSVAGVTFPQSGVSTPDSQAFTAAIAGNDIEAVIGAISQFGTVKALASPRMTVLNNQSAVLNVATNRVFFDIDIESSTEDGVTTTEIDSEVSNVPEGVLINVQPSIDLRNGSISMAVRPTITKINTTVNDPGVAFVVASCGEDCAGISSAVPELNVQEIDSVIKVNSGHPIIMGGLLQDTIAVDDNGVPILSEIPLLGNLFKDHDDAVSKTELVIFLKATILKNPSDSIHNTDKDLYRQFSGDRRPLKF